MANVYKTFIKTDLDNKAVTATSSTQNEKIVSTLSKFVNLFKIKHL
jgi:hypothetical protein